jgi:hypothetical protein
MVVVAAAALSDVMQSRITRRNFIRYALPAETNYAKQTSATILDTI